MMADNPDYINLEHMEMPPLSTLRSNVGLKLTTSTREEGAANLDGPSEEMFNKAKALREGIAPLSGQSQRPKPGDAEYGVTVNELKTADEQVAKD